MRRAVQCCGWVACGMWPAPARMSDSRCWYDPGELGDDGAEELRALGAACQQQGHRGHGQCGGVERQRGLVVQFVQVGGSVRLEDGPERRWQLAPCAGAEGHVLDEVLRRVAVVAGGDHGADDGEVGAEERQLVGERPIAGAVEEAEQRRLVDGGRGHQVGAFVEQRQRDVPAVGVAGDVHGLISHVFDQPREVRRILGPAASTVADLAAGVTTPIPHDNAVPLGQQLDGPPQPAPSVHDPCVNTRSSPVPVIS